MLCTKDLVRLVLPMPGRKIFQEDGLRRGSRPHVEEATLLADTSAAPPLLSGFKLRQVPVPSES